MEPKEWWLVPWSVGWECRSKKPEKDDSIHVIEKSAFDNALKRIKSLEDALSDALKCAKSKDSAAV